jgi:hypothetical protein
MFAAVMPPATTSILTVRDSNMGLFDGMTGGKLPANPDSVVGNSLVVPNPSVLSGPTWANWGKPARLRTADDLALSSGFHNPHALLTLLPNISLSIYKGLP